MKMDEFSQRFKLAVENAILAAETALATPIPRQVVFHLLGTKEKGTNVPIDVLLGALFLGETTFFRVIDVWVDCVRKDITEIIIRPSGHLPCEIFYDEPAGTGPFKINIPSEKSAVFKRGKGAEAYLGKLGESTHQKYQ